MPGRTPPLITGQIYHVLNRGVGDQSIFIDKRDYKRFLQSMSYYQNINPPIRFSRFLTLSVQQRKEILNKLKKEGKILIDFLAFCLMPSHFHFLIEQKIDYGISTFISNLTNSYTRYFNTRHNRNGHLFQGRFKAIRITSEEQLLHVTRYIYLNPYSAYLVKEPEELVDYPYSSLSDVLSSTTQTLINKAYIKEYFRRPSLFKKFIFDQADYQRKLQKIKHLTLEKDAL